MDGKRLLIGSVVGGIGVAVMGFLIYEMIFGSYFEGQSMVAAREAPVIWTVVVASLAHGALLTLAIGWRNAWSVGSGLMTGALVGVLIWLGVDMILYSLMEYSTLQGAITDAALSVVQYGVAGAAIAALAKGGGATVAATAA